MVTSTLLALSDRSRGIAAQLGTLEIASLPEMIALYPHLKKGGRVPKIELVAEDKPRRPAMAGIGSIDGDDLLVELCGEERVAIFRDVKTKSMDIARAVKEVIAEDLSGTLPRNGKQILTTAKGEWRLAPRRNSDNTTEEAMHRRMKVGLVQVFGALSADRRARGWITVEDLYRLHGVKFSPRRMRRRVIARLGAT